MDINVLSGSDILLVFGPATLRLSCSEAETLYDLLGSALHRMHDEPDGYCHDHQWHDAPIWQPCQDEGCRYEDGLLSLDVPYGLHLVAGLITHGPDSGYAAGLRTLLADIAHESDPGRRVQMLVAWLRDLADPDGGWQ